MKPLIVQSDFSMILETTHPLFKEVVKNVIPFSEIERSFDKLYIFKITSLSIWNAASTNISYETILKTLKEYSRFEIPKAVEVQIKQWYTTYGLVSLVGHNEKFHKLIVQRQIEEKIKEICKGFITEDFLVPVVYRGEIKSLLIKEGLPVKDEIGFSQGSKLPFELLDTFQNRDYQLEGASAVFESGNGAVILPCGSGKTGVGVLFASLCQSETLIVTNSSASVKQWKKALLNFTSLKEEDIGTYTSDSKEIKPVTILTYNMASYKNKNGFIHLEKLLKRNWGCLILDEVHLMPAKFFRVICSVQALKRIALTATFVREDGRENDIFTLIGPKRYEKPWKDLEARGYIANIATHEVRVTMSKEDRERYNAATNGQDKFQIAATSNSKLDPLLKILAKHKDENVLIIGQFPKQLEELGKILDLPVVHGETPDSERERVYDAVRNGTQKAFIASSVANAALDIPNLNVLIQISFWYSSRSEETQRQGRITRPSETMGSSYTIICDDTVEVRYNQQRMSFLINEGYTYRTIRM